MSCHITSAARDLIIYIISLKDSNVVNMYWNVSKQMHLQISERMLCTLTTCSKNLTIVCHIDVGQTQPTVDELEEHVISLVATKWYGLGLVLLDTRYKDMLDVIERQHKQVESCSKKMLSKWLEISDIGTWYRSY